MLTVEFVARLRGEKRFDSVDALIEQMHLDVQQTRELC
jgi:riboflavin kinase / FMN adenylyltransferase